MEIKLFRATINVAKELHAMQIEAFRELLDKYQDFDTNPGNESVEKVGAIQLCEEIHGNEEWEPDTIMQEPKKECLKYTLMQIKSSNSISDAV